MKRAVPCFAVLDSRSVTDDHTESDVARKSMIAKANRKPKFKVRAKNRCKRCGRPRGFYRKLKLSRIALRELGSSGQIPGMVKSSW